MSSQSHTSNISNSYFECILYKLHDQLYTCREISISQHISITNAKQLMCTHMLLKAIKAFSVNAFAKGYMFDRQLIAFILIYCENVLWQEVWSLYIWLRAVNQIQPSEVLYIPVLGKWERYCFLKVVLRAGCFMRVQIFQRPSCHLSHAGLPNWTPYEYLKILLFVYKHTQNNVVMPQSLITLST